MAFRVFDNRDESIGFIVIIVAIPICVTAVALRFLCSRLPGRKIGWEDWLALLALIAFLAYSCIDLYILCAMNGKTVFKLGALPMSTVISIYKAGYVMNIQTALNQTFAKLSLLVLYYRVFNVEDIFRYMVWGVGSVQIAWCIAMVLSRLFLCRPIAAAWNPLIKGKCINSQVLLAAGDSINTFIDFVMIGMALWMVSRLHVSRASKWKLSILFALGGFSGVIGIVKIYLTYGTVGNSIINATWNVAQQGTSILCCCVPIYKPLLKSLHSFQKKTFSFLYKSGSKKSQGTASGSGGTYQGTYQGTYHSHENNHTAGRSDSHGGSEKSGPIPEESSEHRLYSYEDDDTWGKNQIFLDQSSAEALGGGSKQSSRERSPV